MDEEREYLLDRQYKDEDGNGHMNVDIYQPGECRIKEESLYFDVTFKCTGCLF